MLAMYYVKIADVIFTWRREIWRHTGPKHNINYSLSVKVASEAYNWFLLELFCFYG